MSEQITLSEKIGELFADPKSIDLDKLTTDIQSQGATVSGYVPGVNGGKEQLLYDNSEALDGALERCGMSLPEKEIETAVEVKKGRGRRVDKGEESIAVEMSP
jgi:hypothetical protein